MLFLLVFLLSLQVCRLELSEGVVAVEYDEMVGRGWVGRCRVE